jgi:uncharacterized protein (DUF433 family)
VSSGVDARDTIGRMSWRELITVDPNVCHGQACVAGTRIPVSVVLDNLAAHVEAEEIVRSYPTLTRPAIDACIAYAADRAREQIVALH